MPIFDEFLKTLDPIQLSEIAAKASESENDAFAGAFRPLLLSQLNCSVSITSG